MRSKWLWIGLAILTLGGGAAAVWHRDHSPAKAGRIMAVQRGDLVDRVTATGTVEPLLKVEVKSKAAGRIEQVLVEEGEKVHAGQVVARVDRTELVRSVNQIQAELDAARARYREALVSASLQSTAQPARESQARAAARSSEADLQRVIAGPRKEEIERARFAVAKAEAAAADAESALARKRKLRDQGLILKRQAEAEVAAAKANLKLLKAGSRPEEIDEAQAALDGATATRKQAEQELQRQQKLHERGFTATRDVEIAQTNLVRAKADERAATERLTVLRHGARPEEIAAAEARLAGATAALDAADANADLELSAAASRAETAHEDVKSAQSQLAELLAGARPEDIAAARDRAAEAEAAAAVTRSDRQQIDLRSQQIAEAAASARRLEESLAAERLKLADTVLTSPIDGTVIQRAIEPGELVASAISQISPSTPVVTVADLSRMIVKTRVNEVDVARLRVGQYAEVRVDAFPEQIFPGTVHAIAPAAMDKAKNASEIVWYEVEVYLDSAARRLRTGMTADVDIIIHRWSNVPKLMVEAVQKSPRRHFVDLITNAGGRSAATLTSLLTEGEYTPATRRVTVELGARDDMSYHIKHGLKPGDLVFIPAAVGARRTFDIKRDGKGH